MVIIFKLLLLVSVCSCTVESFIWGANLFCCGPIVSLLFKMTYDIKSMYFTTNKIEQDQSTLLRYSMKFCFKIVFVKSVC